MHKFTNLSGLAAFSLFIQDEDLGIRDGLPHRSRPPVEFFGRQIG
jgi:hypothetical protein